MCVVKMLLLLLCLCLSFIHVFTEQNGRHKAERKSEGSRQSTDITPAVHVHAHNNALRMRTGQIGRFFLHDAPLYLTLHLKRHTILEK